MLFSLRRVSAIGCGSLALIVITAIIYVATFYSELERAAALQKIKSSFAVKQSMRKPFWTTEQPEPKFAYVQYATNKDYLCNSLINFSRLKRFGAQEDLVLIHPEAWNSQESSENHIDLGAIRTNFSNLHFRPFPRLSTSHGDPTWHDSLNKFHAFALTDYTRVLAFDSDSLVLNNMDHYFLAPQAPVAVPRAYWLNGANTSTKDQILGSHVMLLEPSDNAYNRVVKEALGSGDFDMEVVNHLFNDSAMILPHRRLALLTGEFRETDHARYLAEDKDLKWDPVAELRRAYLVHFSDWPLPKPWMRRSQEQFEQFAPRCDNNDVGSTDRPACADRIIWKSFYEDYERERAKICSSIDSP